MNPKQCHKNGIPIPDADDFTASPEYQAWVESMAEHCRCSRNCPCDGVLSGGFCDDIQDDLESVFGEEED